MNPLSAALMRAKSPEQYHSALRSAQTAFDALNSATIAQLGVTLACRDGCWICCQLRVDVFAHEVFLLADFVRKRFSVPEVESLMGRLAGHTERVASMEPIEHVSQNIRCPMLRDGRCSVYAARPLVCRRYHSQQLAACEYVCQHPEDLEFIGARNPDLFRTLSQAMQAGSDAYADLGYDTSIYELGTALMEAMSNPACWRRWRDGKKAFLRASVTPAAT